MLLDLKFFMYALWIVVCPFVLFLLAIVLSVLPYTDSDYPFGIFKLTSDAYNCHHELVDRFALSVSQIPRAYTVVIIFSTFYLAYG